MSTLSTTTPLSTDRPAGRYGYRDRSMTAGDHTNEESSCDIVLVGVGEMGGVFARGFLGAGHSVHPLRRRDDPGVTARLVPDPALVLVTVGEADLDGALASLPRRWTDRLVLIQNELLPATWLARDISDPTVAVVWFEKKPGQDVKVILSTPVAGRGAGLVVSALKQIGIPAHIVPEGADLEFELVRKNLYILTANVTGLETGGTVAAMWDEHRTLAESVAADVLDVQEHLVGHVLDRPALVDGMVEAIAGDPEHKTTGRSAPARLLRAIDHADAASLGVPTLRDLARRHAEST